MALGTLAVGFRFRTPGQVVEDMEAKINAQKQSQDSAVLLVTQRVATVEELERRVIRRLDRQDRLECLRDRRTAIAAGIPCAGILSHDPDYEPTP